MYSVGFSENFFMEITIVLDSKIFSFKLVGLRIHHKKKLSIKVGLETIQNVIECILCKIIFCS